MQQQPSVGAPPSPPSAQEQIVRALYRGLLGREADPDGLAHWSDSLLRSGDAGALTCALLASDEYRRNCARQGAHARLKTAFAARAAELCAQHRLTVVDIGAQELADEQHVYAPLGAYALPYQLIGFEPLQDKLAERQALEGEAHIRLYPNFIGDGRAQVFHLNNVDATSSLLAFNTALTAQLQDLSHLHTVSMQAVATSRLDEVLADTGRVDFLKLDIQGFELQALQHAHAVLGRTNVIHCEVSFAEIYQGQALFSQVENLLRAEGFEFIDFSSQCRYAYHCDSGSGSRDRLGWGDAIFFKRTELLGEARDVLAQCAIALLIYDKYSLAETLAQHYDRQSGSTLAALFGPGAGAPGL